MLTSRHMLDIKILQSFLWLVESGIFLKVTIVGLLNKKKTILGSVDVSHISNENNVFMLSRKTLSIWNSKAYPMTQRRSYVTKKDGGRTETLMLLPMATTPANISNPSQLSGSSDFSKHFLHLLANFFLHGNPVG